jgi:uncharacterized membrane protein SpoIIM required for sporulation
VSALAPSGPAGSATRFREAREADWTRLEQLLDRIEKGKAGSLSDEDLFELPVLYRATLSSLSVARETSLDVDLVAYLESLSTRAYFILYGVHAPFLGRLAKFFGRDWPLSVRSIWRETVLATLTFFLGAIAAYFLVRADPSWFNAVISPDFAGGRDPTASKEFLRDGLYSNTGHTGGLLGLFATQLFLNNSWVSLRCYALGFAFGVPTLLLLIVNGAMLGALMAVYIPKDLGWNLAGWLSIHGTTEIFAIVISGGAGFRIGWAAAFPGRVSRLQSVIAAGRTTGFAMLGVVMMLVLAGVLEGFGRQLIRDDGARFGIGGIALVLWLCYFYVMPLRGKDDANG